MNDKPRLIKSKLTKLGKEKTGAFNNLVNQKIKIMFSKDKIIKKKWEEKMKNDINKEEQAKNILEGEIEEEDDMNESENKK